MIDISKTKIYFALEVLNNTHTKVLSENYTDFTHKYFWNGLSKITYMPFVSTKLNKNL